MFGNWQQMGMGGVPPPFFAQANMMYPMYPGSQEAAVAAAAAATANGPPPHPHQWGPGGQLAPMVFPPMNHPPMVPPASNTVLEHASSSVGDVDSATVSAAGTIPAPPLPSNPAPPAPPTEEKPPLPPEPPPPDEESKQELTAKNPEEEQRMEQLKQQAAQWQQQKKQLDDAQQQQQYQYQLQQQQFHHMWMATQYPPPPTDHLMTAPPPLPPSSAPAPPLPQHTELVSMSSMGGAIASQATALPPGTSSLTSTTHSVPMVTAEEPTKSMEELKSPEKTPTPVINKSNMNFTKKDPPKHSTSDEKTESPQMEELEKVKKEEEEFNRQYIQWKKQYDDWRDQNRDHPDRSLFTQYEIQFTEIEAKMDEKRQDIIRRKKILKGEYVPDSGDTYMMGKCGRMLDSGSGHSLSSQISQFRNQKKFGIHGGPGPSGQLPEEKNDCGLDRHGKTGYSVGSGNDRVSKLSGIGSGDEVKSPALESAASTSSQKDLNNEKDGNDPFFSKSKSSQDNVLPGGPFLGGTGCNQFAGPRRRFDGNRSRFDGPPPGPRYQGGPGVLGEGPKQECQGPRADKEPEFRDSDMRSQGLNLGSMHGPRFNSPRGGSGFGQSPQSGPPFNQGSFGGPGFSQDIRGFSQNRPGSDTAGLRGLGNRRGPMQRIGGPLDHVGPSDGQFSRFTGHGGMGMGPGANSQHMSERNHNEQGAKNSALSDREIPNKIIQKDENESANSKTRAGEGSDHGGTTMDTNNGYQWKQPELPDATSGFQDTTDPCNSGSSGNNFNNSEQLFNQNDNWRRFGPPPPGSMRGQGVRTRGGLQQPPPPHRNFEEECGPWGMQGPRMGPGFDYNMIRGSEPPGPRMLGGPCGMRPMFNSGIGPLGIGPHHRGMMPRGGGGGMGIQPPFRHDDLGRQIGINLPGNRFDGNGGPRSDLELNSKKREGLNLGEAGLIGSRDQHPNFCSYPGQQFPKGNCPSNSMEMDRDGKRMPNEEFSRQPFDTHQNSSDNSDNWPSRERGSWQENQFVYDNNSRWNPGGNSFTSNQNMNPAFHRGYNRDFPSETGQSQWPADFTGQHSDDNRYNQPCPPLPNAASSMDYRFNNPPDSRDRDYSRGPYDEARAFDRFPGSDYNPSYTETIDYRHKSAKEVFEYNQDVPENKTPTVIDYGHKHPNHFDEQENFKDTDLRMAADGNQDPPRNERGSRIHTDRDRSPIDGGDRLRDSERDRSHGDLDRLRGRDKDADLRSRDVRDRNRPMSRDRDRDRDRDRGRDRDKFRDSRYDQYSRGRERLEDDDKWSDRKHDDRKFDRDSRGRYNSPNRGYHNTDSSRVGESYSKCRTSLQSETKAEVVSADDLLCKPGRDKRPPQVVVIIRGLPGSGKTYVSKLIRDKETSNGGTAPRMLCMDDYFMVEVEKVEKDPETNKMVKKKVLQYEYEPDLEEVYRQSILKSFKKTIDDGFFPFIIYDCVNEKVRHFEEFWSYAKSKGFQVYVATVQSDIATCVRRNIHGRTNQDITKIQKNWEETPKHHIHLDIRSLLQDAAIPEVEMEDTTEEDVKKEGSPPKEKKAEAEEEDEPAAPPGYIKSKWEIDEVGQVRDKVLDKLDGIRLGKRRRSASPTLSLDDYLQLDVYRTRQTDAGKKRVRWADMEERKQQLRRRELGFVVGQTQRDWEKITDDSYADRALNRTKYI